MRMMIEAGPLTVALDTTTSPTPQRCHEMILPPVERTEARLPGTEMWVVDRRVVESWLRLAAACDECRAGVPELMIELDLQGVDDGYPA